MTMKRREFKFPIAVRPLCVSPRFAEAAEKTFGTTTVAVRRPANDKTTTVA
jgi:hypothetical protein